MERRYAWRWVVLAAAVLTGCAAHSGTAISTGAPAANTSWTTVQFDGASVDVPASWPVYELSKDPTLCVRFNVNAVYLGAQGPDPDCPARMLGRADAVQVAPLGPTTAGQLLPALSAVNPQGLVVQEQPNSDTTRTIVAAFPKLGVLVTASYLQDPSVAQRIVDSVAAA